MSLTLPTAYSNSSKLGNIQENWIVQLGYDDEGANDWTGIALSDTTVGGVFIMVLLPINHLSDHPLI